MWEYKQLIKELSRSPYHQNPSSQPTVSSKDEQGKEINRTVGERFNGLLHKSVRKRIESESHEVPAARENRSKAKSCKIVRPRVRERVAKERSLSSYDKGGPSSPKKHESSQNKLRPKESENELIRGNELHIHSSKLDEDLGNASKECELEHDKHSPAKLVNELPLANENTDKIANEIKVGENNLKNCQESKSLEDDGTSYPTCSNGTDSTQNEYLCSSSSSDEEELTMDEVDVRDLKIVSCAEKNSGFTREAGSLSEISSRKTKPQETVEDICNEVVNDLIEQVVKKSDTNSTRGILLNGGSVDATQLCEGQSSDTNLHVHIPNGNQNHPDSLGLDMEEPINGHVCESNEGSSWTSEGQHNGVLAIGKVEDGYSNAEDLDQACDKMPVAAAEAVPSRSDLGCSTTELEQNGHREKSDSTITSKSEEGQRNETLSSLCGNPAGVVTDSVSDMSGTNTNAASPRPEKCTVVCYSEEAEDNESSKDCGSPGSEYHDSLEDLVTDGGKSDEKFLEESSSDLLQDYKTLKKNDFTTNRYSSKNINLPKDKNIEKPFFKDLIDGKKENIKTTTSGNETKTSDMKHGESNPESLDSGVNVCHKDSRTSSELSEYYTTSIDSSTPRGCPGDCKSTLGDSGLCLFHEGSDNVSHSETEFDSNPDVPVPEDNHGDDDGRDRHGDDDGRDHRGDDDGRDHHGDDDDASELGATSSEQKVAEKTTQDNDGEEEEKEVDSDEEVDDNDFEVCNVLNYLKTSAVCE